MLTFPEKTFPLPPRTCPRSGFVPEQTSCARALCEDFRQFLSAPSITEHGLCEDFPKILLDGSPVAGSAEKSLFMQKLGEHLHEKENLFLWHFEGKIQKNASEYRSFVRIKRACSETIYAKSQTNLESSSKISLSEIPEMNPGFLRG